MILVFTLYTVNLFSSVKTTSPRNLVLLGLFNFLTSLGD